ncbi:hypothetical protein CYMTET_21449 [Cymbomonas tetramitiformis]|uniref:Uncharacterized protein n=1 Tax=Cymbomonas tetramitiformis TaxID=36881 RepID=A0AAE0G3C1_9CHLO|nr:hypothetical protein CYMTET_21449 [Cymbomonas tetramitiformis]
MRGVAVRPAVGIKFLRRSRWLYPSIKLQIEKDDGIHRVEFNVGDSIIVNGEHANWFAILEGIGHRRGDLKKRIELKVGYLETPQTLLERLGPPRVAKDVLTPSNEPLAACFHAVWTNLGVVARDNPKERQLPREEGFLFFEAANI